MASAATLRPGQLGETWWTVAQVPHGMAFDPPGGLRAGDTGANENVVCRDDIVPAHTPVSVYAADQRRALAPFAKDSHWQELGVPEGILPGQERVAFTTRFSMHGEIFYQAHAYVRAGARIGTACWTCQDERLRSVDRFWHILSCLQFGDATP